MPTHILIADDHSIIRKGVKLTLQLLDKEVIIYEAETCNEIMVELKKNAVTHLISDITFPDGSFTEVLPNIQALYPRITIMVFSMQPAEVYATPLKNMGVNYYLQKNASSEALSKMLQDFMSNRPTAADLQVYIPEIENLFSSLSTRELEVLQYLLKGINAHEICSALNLKPSTVSTMKSRIFQKTNCNTIIELSNKAGLFNINM